MSTNANVEISRLNEAVCMGWCGRLSIALWRLTPDDAVGWWDEECKRGIAKFGKGFGHMPVIEAGAPPWSPTARKGLMDVVRKHHEELDLVVPIIGGRGFAGAAVRAMGAGMLLLVPNIRVKIKIVGTVEEAADNAMKYLPDSSPQLTRDTVAAALESMRGKLAEHNAPKASAG